MPTLEPLPSIARLSSRVVRILGQNPGKFTLQGTNTYLVGTTNPFILVDTGEGKEEYVKELELALNQHSDPSRQLVSDIILTHRHHDHTDGLPSVLNLLRLHNLKTNTPPRIHKYPILQGDQNVLGLLEKVPPDAYVKPSGSGPGFHSLQQAQLLTSPGCTLQVLHTPGHTTDSICLYLAEETALFTADTVLGHGTAVFEDLLVYMQSLQGLLHFNDEQAFQKLYPGHGSVVNDGPKLIKEYIDHRIERENQILQHLASSSPNGTYIWTIRELVSKIYADYPKSLWGPAAGSLCLHLLKLEKNQVVLCLDDQKADGRWVLTNKYNAGVV